MRNKRRPAGLKRPRHLSQSFLFFSSQSSVISTTSIHHGHLWRIGGHACASPAGETVRFLRKHPQHVTNPCSSRIVWQCSRVMGGWEIQLALRPAVNIDSNRPSGFGLLDLIYGLSPEGETSLPTANLPSYSTRVVSVSIPYGCWPVY